MCFGVDDACGKLREAAVEGKLSLDVNAVAIVALVFLLFLRYGVELHHRYPNAKVDRARSMHPPSMGNCAALQNGRWPMFQLRQQAPI